MRRLTALALTALLPVSAAAQSSLDDMHDVASRLLAQQPSDGTVQAQPGSSSPLWRGANGRMLALHADDRSDQTSSPLSFSAVNASGALATGLRYNLSPSLVTHADLTERSWTGTSVNVLGGEFGATYNAGRYSVGLSLGSDSMNHSARLPRILPGAAPGVNGLSAFDSSTQLNARGRLALDSHNGIDLGASVGRIHLLPGNVLGVNTLDQKALSFGVDHGPLSGSIVGREMQPAAGGIPGAYGPDRRWSSIDLGVTWRLPWQGQLSIGAQNLWSSGSSPNTPAGPEPDQSRTPYVQYHQDL